MGEAWRRYFTCGVVVPSFYPEGLRGDYPLVEACLRVARDDFFGAAEIVPLIDSQARRELAEQAHVAGLTLVSAIAIAYRDQGIGPAAEGVAWEQSLEKATHFVDEAYEIGCPLQQVSGGPDTSQTERPAARRRVIEFYIRLCEYAHKRHPGNPLSFTLEPVDRDVQIKGLIGPTEEAVEVVNAVRRHWPNFGLTLDLAHIPQVGESFEQAVETAGEVLDHIHLANTVIRQKEHPLYGDKHPLFGVPGGEFDVNDVARFLTFLEKSGFFRPQFYAPKPIISVEVRPSPGQSSDLVYVAAKRRLRDAFAIVDWPAHSGIGAQAG